jgi:hypothetical protein
LAVTAAGFTYSFGLLSEALVATGFFGLSLHSKIFPKSETILDYPEHFTKHFI